MADDTECDVAANGEVFGDVDSDPGSIINNVVQSCSKILIPSMAQPSMSKLSSNDEDAEVSDGIFQGMKSDDDTSDHQIGDEVINIKPDHDDKRRVSVHSPRAVKWTLDTMAAAMDSVFGGELTTTNAARKFQIPRTTLLDRLSMKVKRQHLEAQGSFPLNAENDAKVVEFVQANEDLDKPTLIKGILKIGEQLAKIQGRPFDGPLTLRKWLKLFVHKHPNLQIFSYNRSRNATFSRSSLSISSGTHGLRTSVSNENAVLVSPQILHIQHHSSLSGSQLQVEQENEDSSSPTTNDNDNVFDSLESSLARQGAKAIEDRLNVEQISYFNYRYINKNLEKGYELWNLCRLKSDGGDNFSALALNGIEQSLISEHLKYFRFRFENPDLDEGYKLWALLKDKIHD